MRNLNKIRKMRILMVLLSISMMTMTTIPTVFAYSSSINFYGEKTDVHMGEDILAKLSIVNLVSNPKMHAQVIILPSSGMSVTSADFTKVSAGQFAADYTLEPGDGRDVEIRLRSNQVGEFNIKGRVVYYFGSDSENTQDYALELPVSVRRTTVLTAVEDSKSQPKGLQGFEVLLLGVGIIAFVIIFSVILIYMLRK